MQLIAGVARHNTSFLSLSKQHHFLTLNSTCVIGNLETEKSAKTSSHYPSSQRGWEKQEENCPSFPVKSPVVDAEPLHPASTPSPPQSFRGASPRLWYVGLPQAPLVGTQHPLPPCDKTPVRPRTSQYEKGLLPTCTPLRGLVTARGGGERKKLVRNVER